MNPSNLHWRVLALAGVFQTATMVKSLATRNQLSEPAFLASIESLFTLEVSRVQDIYPTPKHLLPGVHALIRHFNHDKTPKDPDIARYVFSLLHLERKLSDSPPMLKQIRTGIERASTQALYFSPTHGNVMANLASLYTDTISTFSFRIQVTGEPTYLNQVHILNKVRALLLSGIRSAVLWHQLGGRQWQLLISRRTVLQAAGEWVNAYALDLIEQ